MLNPILGVNPPPDVETARLSRVDCCHRCGNQETPESLPHQERDRFIATYRCTDCHTHWSTGWIDD